jgi:preprotein translocase subunit Sss1
MTDTVIVKIITIILSGFVGFLIGRLIYKILNDK